ncbi:MAG: hypothetical protein JWO37_3333 [Acidimicrobiales bacterium]|nr:hypothetical protein [Acidimicrobiales bacterium]
MASSFLPPIASPFRLTVGLRRIAATSWIDADDNYEADLVERERVLDAHRDDVVQSLATDASRSACAELLDVLVASLPGAPAIWARSEGGAVEVVPTGWRLESATTTDPLDAAAHLVADDLCVLDGETLVLLAGAVCFPNRWRLSDKLGRAVTDIHDPVPRYRDELGDRVTQVLTKLRPDTVLERRNWSILLDPTLHQPEYAPSLIEHVDTDAGHIGELAWVRVERQTLRRLPQSGAVVFGIRTRQRKLTDLGDDDRDRLARAVTELPADMAAYKSLTGLRSALGDIGRRVSGRPPS